MFNKIEPKKRSHLAAKMLIEVIREQKIGSGGKLPPERIMAQEMGLSRNTVREAIAALQVMGILETRHSQGNFIVKSVDQENFDTLISFVFKNEEDPFALIEARIAFEPGVALLSSQVCSRSDIENLSASLERIRKALLAEDIATYRIEDQAFHLSIAQNTRNPLIVKTIVSLMNAMNQPLWQTMKKALTDTKLRDDRIKEHEDIFRAIAEKDEPAILKAVKAHLENSKARFLVDEETG